MENPDTTEFPLAVGARLRTWRRSLRKTQDEMAVLLHVNPTGYRRYELGRNSPGAAVLAAACGLGLNLNWLLTGRDHMLLRDSKSNYSADDFVLDRLATSLERLRAVDPHKFEMLSRGFIARSEEAGENALLRRSVAHGEGGEFGNTRFSSTVFPDSQFQSSGFPESVLFAPTGFEDIITGPVDIPLDLPLPTDTTEDKKD